jgi:protein involved in sex pheromone biosynthesis
MMKNILILAAIATAVILSGCASVPMASPEEDAEAKNFSDPPANKAGLYVYRDTFVGQALKKTVYLDGDMIGETANKVYFYNLIDPGQHTLSTESEFSDNDIQFEAKGGKNHFAEQYIKMGIFVGGANLRMVSEEEGRKAVLECKLAKQLGQPAE